MGLTTSLLVHNIHGPVMESYEFKLPNCAGNLKNVGLNLRFGWKPTGCVVEPQNWAEIETQGLDG